MPLFEFKCPKCKESKEIILKSYLEPLPCKCGCQMERQVARVNFELKGDGWFKDGYK